MRFIALGDDVGFPNEILVCREWQGLPNWFPDEDVSQLFSRGCLGNQWGNLAKGFDLIVHTLHSDGTANFLLGCLDALL